MDYFKDFLKGLVIGVANIIPGVSGGTMALVLGIYERIIDAINNISADTVKSFLGLFRFNRAGLEAFLLEAKKIDAWFLVRIAAGALAAIVALAKVMTFLLTQWHDPTYGFFFGLVLVSTAAPWVLMKKRGMSAIAIALCSAFLLVGVSQFFSGDKLVEKAKAKQEMTLNARQSPQADQETPREFDAGKAGYMFIAGALGISAMILPGISGSFLLLLMGAYFDILKAIAGRDVFVLAFFGLGCIIGLLLFSRLLELLLKKWHDGTMSFLVGLVLGSLWIIWPFKTTVTVGSETVYVHNMLPAGLGANEIYTIAAFAAGAVIVLVLFMIEQKQNR